MAITKKGENMRKKVLVVLMFLVVLMGLVSCNNKSSDKENFVVTWIVDGKTTMEIYEEGSMPSYKLSTDKASNSVYEYEFIGWDKELELVKEDVTYEALYEEKYVEYIYTWVVNGVETKEIYHYGDTPLYKGEIPTKPDDEGNSYVFAGWDKELSTVMSDMTLVAQFNTVSIPYTISFDVDGVVTEKQFQYGTIPSYGTTPTKEATDKYVYEFAGWKDIITGIVYEKELPEITAEVTYKAIFNEVEKVDFITINMYYLDGTLIETKTISTSIGQEYKVDAPKVDGYVANNDYVKGIVKNNETINFYYSEVSVWDNISSSSTLNGEGTKDNPFLIICAADLVYLQSDIAQGNLYSSSYVMMTKSIDLNGANFIFDNFAGYFDGNNCSIRGLAIDISGNNGGLFAQISETAEIKNLSLYGSIKAGGVVGAFVGDSKGKITNVTNYASIQGGGKRGGIAGVTTGALTNCVNYGDVNNTTSGWNVGGIAGEAHSDVINCVNHGAVYGTTTHIGGIVGSFFGEKLDGCINYGAVSGASWGGAGIAASTTSLTAVIENCINYGSVSGTGQIGGIVGKDKSIVKNCVNYGSINGTSSLVGGIVGDDFEKVEIKIMGCTNYGDVTADKSIGGIVGRFFKGEIADCTNYGTINGTSTVSGIAGELPWSDGGSIKVTNCINNGDVNGTSYFISGIVGTANYAVISGCINNGNIITTGDCAGGIAGAVYDTSTISGCTNNGLVKGKTNLGGIVFDNRGIITGCTNNGNLELTTVGGTAASDGIAHTNTGTVSNCINNGIVIEAK